MRHGKYGNKYMKILVTGSNGYIGTMLCDTLLKAGHKVTGLDTGFYEEAWLFAVQKPETVIKKDVRAVTKEDFVGYDAVVHLAELSNDPLGQTNPALTYSINHEGTRLVATMAKSAGVPRFVYASSCSVYGASDRIADETSSTNPLTAYAKSKVMNEEFLVTITDDTFCPVLLRFATVYGPSPRLRLDLAVNNLAALAFTTGEIKMDSDGTPWRPFTHVLDIAQGVICALNAPKEIVSGQIFNVGSEASNYQIKDIAAIVQEVFPNATVSLNKDGADRRNYKVNFDKIKNLPGLVTKFTVRDGVMQLKEIFERSQLNQDDFSSRLYTRLKQVKHLQDTKQIDENLYWL